MKPQLKKSYSASTTFQDEPLEIIGEVYDLPIHQTQDVKLHTRIKFVTNGFVLNSKTRYFAEELSQADLEKNVNHYKDNLKDIF